MQDETLRRRLDRGERLVGVKLGLTSRAKQQRMGMAAPLTAWLTDAMVLPAGAAVPRDRLIHPRAEPEIVFVMRDRLAGPGVTAATALAAVGAVYGGVEVIDSRYRDFRFTLPDVVADNASSGCFVTGPVGRAAGQAWTWPWRHACWRWTGRSWTRPRARPCRGIRPRRSRWPPTTWAAGGWPSSPAGSCSPAA